ncbi:hypothetical protein ACUF8J_002133 [Enterobacter hormaechei]
MNRYITRYGIRKFPA